MALDMEQLRKMFYEECRENLEVLEDVLLNLDVTSIDEESINTIFGLLTLSKEERPRLICLISVNLPIPSKLT